MTKSKLKTRIKNFVKNELSDYGFSLVVPMTAERTVDGMIQGINFQSGTSYLTGKYTMNIYWRFKYFEKDYISLDGTRRIGELIDGKDLWLTFEGELLEEDFQKAKELVLKGAIPYLEEYASLRKLLESVENGNISKSNAFGVDVGWQCFNAGFSYAAIGQAREALQELIELVEFHSDRPVDWVQERKAVAQNKINELKGK
ncbi:DUF4304 domain-containing protein [Vibrio sp. HN007]|uniref:DUF4304 domain-containing protein n=1 Tax=Vibrio iocasae TaxID=3098914 RepID=UPI0035D4DAE9